MSEEQEKERQDETASLDDLLAKVDPLSGSDKAENERDASEATRGAADPAASTEEEAAEPEGPAASFPAAEASGESDAVRGATEAATTFGAPTGTGAGGEPIAEEETAPSGTAQDGQPAYPPNVQRLLDIQLPVTVSFGSTQKPLEEILKLTPGSVIELDTEPDDPVVLLVNGKPLAWGRVVDVDGYYAVEITEIVERAERIQTLGG